MKEKVKYRKRQRGICGEINRGRRDGEMER
jgi:hypothetical protein